MKNSILLTALLCMLMVSCISEDMIENQDDKFFDATFTVFVNDQYKTHTKTGYSDLVACAVYDDAGNELDYHKTLNLQGNKAVYNVKLPKGLDYRVAFFAYKGNANGESEYYDVSDLKNISVKPASANIEERDAFSAYVEFKTSNLSDVTTFSQQVTLGRIYAQLNLGINKEELDAAVASGIEVSKSRLKASNVYNTYSAYENHPVGSPSDAIFEMNELPAGKFIEEDEEYYYLSQNFLLVDNPDGEQSKTNIELSWITAEGTESSSAISFKEIPVQTNYRTNITGRLLTNHAIYNVTHGEMADNRIQFLAGNQVNSSGLSLLLWY